MEKQKEPNKFDRALTGAVLARGRRGRYLATAALEALLIGWPLGGTLITIDDDHPGRWSNPDGKFVREWLTPWWWADLLLVRGSLVAAAFGAEEALAGHFAADTLAATVLMAVVGMSLFLRGLRIERAHAG